MNSRLVLSVIWAFIAAVFTGVMLLSPIAERLENQYGLGILYALRPQVAPAPGALIVALDRRTLEWLRDESDVEGKAPLRACLPPAVGANLGEVRGLSSIPRAVHGCLLAELAHRGFTTAIFDILFAVPGAPADDGEFAGALRAGKPRTGLLIGFERSVVRDGISEALVEKEIQPIELFRESATTTGTFIVTRSGGPVYGYWPRLAAFPETKSMPEQALLLSNSLAYLVKTQSLDRLALRYFWLYGPPGSVQTVSARDVLAGNVAIDNVAPGTVAFIGASDPSSTNYPDTFPTFIRGGSGADLSGVELVATAYLNLLHDDTLHRMRPWHALITVVALSAAIGFLARFNPTYALLLTVPIALVFVGIATWLFSRYHLFIPVATPVFILLPAAFVVAIFMRYRFARSLIMRLAPAPVARRRLGTMTEQRGKATLDEATVIFFDLIGSSKISEHLPPADVSVLLNSYHDTITRVVDAHGGFVSAYQGDGVMAAFTKVDAGRDHAVKACRSAIRAVQEISLLNLGKSHPPLQVRIGLNSGPVAEAEIGGATRFNFTVVGDVVNLASRLEQLGKVLFAGEGDVILVGHRTRESALVADLKFVDCGVQKIRGRDNSELVYRLLIP